MDCFQYPICTGVVWVSLARIPRLHAYVNCSSSFHTDWAMGCLSGKVVQLSCRLGHGLSGWQGCPAFMPFGPWVVCLARLSSFHAVWAMGCLSGKVVQFSCCVGHGLFVCSFGLLVNHSASFQATLPHSSPFCLLILTTSLHPPMPTTGPMLTL